MTIIAVEPSYRLQFTKFSTACSTRESIQNVCIIHSKYSGIFALINIIYPAIFRFVEGG